MAAALGAYGSPPPAACWYPGVGDDALGGRNALRGSADACWYQGQQGKLEPGPGWEQSHWILLAPNGAPAFPSTWLLHCWAHLLKNC